MKGQGRGAEWRQAPLFVLSSKSHGAHWRPLQMMAFSGNERGAGLSPIPLVISCQKILDGRGNAQTLMR